jgi:PhnB protein
MSDVRPIPEGYPQVAPYLSVIGAAAAIDFYREVFGATERGDRMVSPDGTIGHAELLIGDSLVMIADEYPEHGFLAPPTVGGSAVTMHTYLPDVDGVVSRAVEAGANLIRPVETHFYGDRSGLIEDPFGHRWSISTHVEEVGPDEMARRVAELGSE